MDKPLKDIVKERMKQLKIGIPELAEATGIPAPRIYKWYSKERPANPKEADSDTLRKWLGESSISSKQDQVAKGDQDETDLKKAIRDLSESAKLHTVIHDRDSRSIERLITLLELKLGVNYSAMELPEIGEDNVVDIRERSKKSQPKK